ncbi:MAG: asparaginase [Phycisphaeraceae bacterium]|nr:asparaginase [Phycisphaerales bacterium]MCB9859283.1 asparaginase [Phycisphaeraceae bacterium]
MARVSLLSTGGTIASFGSGLVSGDALLEALGLTSLNTEWSVEEVFRVPSSQVTPQMQVELARRIDAASQNADTVIVTHGTDSMEESAFMADVLCQTSTPVVFTGAMRPGSDGDGSSNLVDAATVGLACSTHTVGVTVVMNGLIHAPSEVRKLHSGADDAFYSRTPLGLVEGERVSWSGYKAHRFRITLPDIRAQPAPDVWLIRVGVGEQPQIRAAQETGVRGLVIEVFGKGNMPSPALDEARACAQHGMVVVCTSRCGDGDVQMTYLDDNFIAAPHLDGLKARLLLMLCLGAGMNRQGVQQVFNRN